MTSMQNDSTNGNPTLGFALGMGLLATLAIGGQIPGLFALMGFSGEKAQWDARAASRDELSSELEVLQGAMQASKLEADGLEPILTGRKAELAALREALLSAEASREDAFSQRAGALAKASSAEANATEAVTRKEETDLARSTLIQGNSELASKRDALQGEVNELVADAAGLEQKRQQKDRAQERLNQVQSEVLDAQARLESLGKQLASRSEEAAEAEVLVAKRIFVKSEVSALTAQKTRATVEADELQGRVTELERQKADLLSARSGLEGENQDLGNQRRDLLLQVGSLEGQQDSLRKDIATMDELLSGRSNLEQTVMGLESTKRTLASTIASDERNSKGLRDEVATLQADAAVLKATTTALSDVETRLASGQAELNQLRIEHATLTGEIEILRTQESSLRESAVSSLGSYADRFGELATAIETTLRSLAEAKALAAEVDDEPITPEDSKGGDQ
jgi:chromosome segregation ATPase